LYTARSAVLQQIPPHAGTGEIIVYEYVYEYGGLHSVLLHVLLHTNPISTFGSRLFPTRTIYAPTAHSAVLQRPADSTARSAVLQIPPPV